MPICQVDRFLISTTGSKRKTGTTVQNERLVVGQAQSVFQTTFYTKSLRTERSLLVG